jgi:hypothetical protein
MLYLYKTFISGLTLFPLWLRILLLGVALMLSSPFLHWILFVLGLVIYISGYFILMHQKYIQINRTNT